MSVNICFQVFFIDRNCYMVCYTKPLICAVYRLTVLYCDVIVNNSVWRLFRLNEPIEVMDSTNLAWWLVEKTSLIFGLETPIIPTISWYQVKDDNICRSSVWSFSYRSTSNLPYFGPKHSCCWSWLLLIQFDSPICGPTSVFSTLTTHARL